MLDVHPNKERARRKDQYLTVENEMATISSGCKPAIYTISWASLVDYNDMSEWK